MARGSDGTSDPAAFPLDDYDYGHDLYHCPPVVLGGQGRDADDLRDGAGAIAWLVGAVVVLLAALAVWGCS